jgi:uncharacterized membrane protein
VAARYGVYSPGRIARTTRSGSVDLRLARGEIDVDDYERLRRELGHHHEIG